MRVEGQAAVKIGVGRFVIRHNVVVVDCSDEGILGMDVLTRGSARIDLASRTVSLDGMEVPMKSVDTEVCHRVSLASGVVVRAGHRSIVEGRIVGQADGEPWMVEPLYGAMGEKDLLVARTLTCGGDVVPVEVLNLTAEDVFLYQGTHVAVASPVSEVTDVGALSQTDEEAERVSRLTAEKTSRELPDGMEEMVQGTELPMTRVEREQLREMLGRHLKTFQTTGESLGRTDLVRHEIDTRDARPAKQRARRLPVHMREEASKQVAQLKENGLIEPSTSPWASPVVLVRKKDGSVRFCVDYRKLNAVTIKDAYPLPRIDDTLDALSGADRFSTLDLASGYWQVGMEEDAKQKSAFVCGEGLYQFRVMPFGLVNAPATFERLMERVLTGLQWQTCLVYLDDIIIYSKGADEHRRRLEEVLGRLDAAGLKLKPSKCQLMRKSVTFLGHVVSSEGVATDPEKVKAVREWQTPDTLRNLRSFLGLCSYYRRFIEGFSTLAKPLTKLTEKGKEFVWGKDQATAWEELKKKLVSAPILAYPDPKKTFILDTDASGVGIGAVLSQEQGGRERVIAYGSRTLTKEERRYCVTRRELLAVVYFTKLYRHYLYGQKFTVRTDHGALLWLTNFKDPQGQLARWLEVLGTYHFEIQHRPGLKHGNADALSRGPCNQCGRENHDAGPTEQGAATDGARRVMTRSQGRKIQGENDQWMEDGVLNRRNLEAEQAKDEDVSWIMSHKETGVKPTWLEVASRGAESKAYWGQWESLRTHQGLLCREKRRDGQRKTKDDGVGDEGRRIWRQTVIPRALRERVLHEMHNSPTAGHLGTRRNLTAIRTRFYWPRMKEMAMDWCKQCARCAARKPPQRKARAAMQKYQVGVPMERVAIDVMGPLPVSARGNRYVIVMADYFTKWAEAIATPNQEAKTVADVFVRHFLTKFGAPRMIHTDQGRNFESRLFAETCKMLGIKKTRTTVYHPQSDGMVERFNRTLGTMIVAYAAERPRTWDERLPLLTMAYRATPHESTGHSPNRVMFGREVTLPVDLMLGSPSEERAETTQYAAELRDRLEEVYAHVRGSLQVAAERQRRNYDVNASGAAYGTGDLVWRMNKTRRKGISPKLQARWLGPCVVIERINAVTYKLQVSRDGTKILHFDLLKPYSCRDVPEWVARRREQLRGSSRAQASSERE